MRRRAAIDSSSQLCLWDELEQTADEREGSAAASGGVPAALPPATSAAHAPAAGRPMHRSMADQPRPGAPDEAAR